MLECPLCHEPVADMQGLAEHLVRHHTYAMPKRPLLCEERDRAVLCWCLKWFAVKPGYRSKWHPLKSSLAEHLEERGGVLAHLLEVGLGLDG